MKKPRNPSALLRAVTPREPPPVETERVVELFRNRAEIKKAYSAAQQELHRLTDRLKQQEGATVRVQELLEALEQRLASPETAPATVVFYQLRGLWETGRRLIEQQLAALARQHEEGERRLHFAESNRRRFARRQQVEAELREREAGAAAARQGVAALAARRGRLVRIWHWFERRRVDAALAAARSASAAADAALAEARSACEVLAAEEAADFPGLSLEARRAINLAAIACAEVLCARLAGTTLVARARDSVMRREATDDYGTRQECERLMTEIARARELLAEPTGLAQALGTQLGRLKTVARYRAGSDTVPVPESIGAIEVEVPVQRKRGAEPARVPNVLAEDTWDLFRVLLR